MPRKRKSKSEEKPKATIIPEEHPEEKPKKRRRKTITEKKPKEKKTRKAKRTKKQNFNENITSVLKGYTIIMFVTLTAVAKLEDEKGQSRKANAFRKAANIIAKLPEPLKSV